MINRDRVLKLLRDLKEWQSDFMECTKSVENCNNDIKKILYHSIRAYFLDFHILCEDYISISLKDLNKYKIDISAIEGMEIIKDSNKISDEFFEFYSKSRRLRNRLAHRYKMPSDEELLVNLKNNFEGISELERSIKELVR
ncbi:HepT-like ribonuclease domain-containing protein [Clostridium sp. C2-6-12]|uniref:HepT-like ribonuclease domain-containing protein n=1 Tax=Clostridium sp. C2-6-12 TaxID=2698832 RepID=UPI001368B765|nr:HepT-like ribonuclease domain-containing protein [Clostridium sp. C2-6-12]